MNTRGLKTRRQLAWVGACVLTSMSAGMAVHEAHAADPAAAASPTAQAALQTLLSSQVGKADPSTTEVVVAGTGAASAGGGAPGSAAAYAVMPAGAGGRTVVPVARGQALDALLRQHLAGSPLRIEVQRELVRKLNPQAFAQGNGYRLVVGARLQMPTLQDQAQHAFGKVLVAADASADRQAEERAGGGAAAAARKGWVRYP